MFEIPLLLILIVLVALVFDFTNGAHDCANAIATVVSTKVVTPRFAVGMAAALNLASGPAWARAAPTRPPMSAWEDDEGMPKYQVRQFQKMAPSRAASTRIWLP